MLTLYLDYNATAPIRLEARQAMLDALGPPANASSIHHFGQMARYKIEKARQQVADLAGAEAENIIFTSGGTEANAMALCRNYPSIITSSIEHTAVLSHLGAHLGRDAVIPVDSDGVIDLNILQRACDDAPPRSLVSVMAANNETGVIQPLKKIIAIAHSHNHLVHSDAVQGFGKMPLYFTKMGLDLMSISAHKIGGPAGVGALVQRQGLAAYPRFSGGGQEKNKRPGTENFIGIVGFGAAAEAAKAAANNAHWEQLRQWHDAFEDKISGEVPNAMVFGQRAKRLANTTLIAMPGRPAETQVINFDLNGIAISAGAACSSGKVENSHVLLAMKAEDLAPFAVRISSGWATEKSDFDRLAEIWLKIYKQT